MNLSSSLVFNQLCKHTHWKTAQFIINQLHSNGHIAYLAGGCVRDAILGREANDLDIATNATPDQVEKYFKKTIAVGKSFGVIIVVEDNIQIEVATFRTDGKYEDGRRPTYVEYSSPKEDAVRRDFTINALFFDPLKQEIIDFVEGLKAIQLGIIETVGDADQRFLEDHLRLLRAVRFSVQLNFKIEETTFKSIQKNAGQIKNVSRERISDELTKLFVNQDVYNSLNLFKKSNLLEYIFPLLDRFCVNQMDEYKKVSHLRLKTLEETLIVIYSALILKKTISLSEVEKDIHSLRLSNIESKNLLRALSWIKNEMSFWQQQKGQQIETFFDHSIAFASSIYLLYMSDKHLPLINELKTLASKKPEPFINGNDLQNLVSGEKLGQCLKYVYWAQLEEKIGSRAEAMQFAQDWLLKNNKDKI